MKDAITPILILCLSDSPSHSVHYYFNCVHSSKKKFFFTGMDGWIMTDRFHIVK